MVADFIFNVYFVDMHFIYTHNDQVHNFLMNNLLMILCLFNCESDADKFLKFLNTQHPNIKLTFEK